MAHVNCPKCGQRLNLPPIQETRGVRCTACKHEFAVSPPSQPQPLPGDYTGEGAGVFAKTSLAVLAALGIALIAVLIYKTAAGPGSTEEPPQPAPIVARDTDPKPQSPKPKSPAPIVAKDAALPVGWQRVKIPEVGTIDIPPSMEVQSGPYARLSKAFKKSLLKDSTGSAAGRITIQPKGLNALDSAALNFYVRVMVTTDVGNAGDFESLNSKFEATSDELRDVSTLFRTQAENAFKNTKILQWDAPSLELVNGMQAIRMGYRRRLRGAPPVRVTAYIFQNYDRMHMLTMSYRESERSKWLSDFPGILRSFRITNVIGPSVNKSQRGTYVDKKHNFSIRFPEGWTVKEALMPGRSIVIKAIHRGEQAELANLIIYAYRTDKSALSTTTATAREVFDATNSNASRDYIDGGETQLAGKRAIWVISKSKDDVTYTVSYMLTRNDTLFCLSGGTVLGGKEWFQKNKQRMVTTIKSFKFLGAGE